MGLIRICLCLSPGRRIQLKADVFFFLCALAQVPEWYNTTILLCNPSPVNSPRACSSPVSLWRFTLLTKPVHHLQLAIDTLPSPSPPKDLFSVPKRIMRLDTPWNLTYGGTSRKSTVMASIVRNLQAKVFKAVSEGTRCSMNGKTRSPRRSPRGPTRASTMDVERSFWKRRGLNRHMDVHKKSLCRGCGRTVKEKRLKFHYNDCRPYLQMLEEKALGIPATMVSQSNVRE